MAEMSEAAWQAAEERGRIELATKPRARAARYDQGLGRLVIELTNGCTFFFPPRLAQGLEKATDEEIAQVEILGFGFGLHWEALDADHKVESLLAGRFGSQRYMEERFGPDWHQAAQAA
jgi:Protein of unknown function (DUF2442)